MSTHGAQSTFPSVTNLGRDVFWERTVASLQPLLVEALRAAGLDDPGTLVEYPRSTLEEVERALGLTLGGSIVLASSGAASSEKCTATYGHSLPLQVPEWSSLAGSVSVGGVPKTGHASFTSETGGDPRTDHSIFGEAYGVEKGGDPKTDHASLCADVVDEMAASLSAGGLATQTATSDPVSPGLNILISRFLAVFIMKFLMDSRTQKFQKFTMDCRVLGKFQRFAMDCRVLEIYRVKHIQERPS